MNENLREMFSSLYSIKREVDRELMAYLADIKSKRMREILLYYAGEGKRHLPWFTVLAAECLGGDRKKAVKCAALLEIIHKISLMVDDIVDRHDRRKGRPTPASVFGEAEAILAEVRGLIFVLRKIEAEMGRDVFQDACKNVESISDGVLNEFEWLRQGNQNAKTREHYAVNRAFFRMFTEAGIALASPETRTSKYKKALLHYSEKMAEMATIYDDAEDVITDLRSGKLKRVFGLLGRFGIGRRISDMTEGEIKKMMLRSDAYRKMAGKIDILAEGAVKSLKALPQSGAKSHLTSLALFMKELHKEQKDMEIQRHIEKLFSGMAKGKK